MRLDLDPIANAPFAVALSGGGDSTALVHALATRQPHVFIVDHGLRSGSGDDAVQAQIFAQSLGLTADILRWSSPPIKSGLQAKARKARYGLLGEACRARGIMTLLTGHTQDDQAETVLMRLDAQTGWRGAAGIAAVSYAPLWPELAGVTLRRPMLGLSRADIRDYLAHHALSFTDDPSNENRDFTRIRARDRLSLDPILRADMLCLSRDMQMGLEAEREHLQMVSERVIRTTAYGFELLQLVPPRLLGLCMTAAGGGGGPIDMTKVRALHRRLASHGDMTATLMGAQIVKAEGKIQIMRDPGAAMGRANKAPIESRVIAQGLSLWDGRIWLNARRDDLRITPLAGHMASLPKAMQGFVRQLPAGARPTLPLIWRGGVPTWVGLGGLDDELEIRWAVSSRLRGNLLPNPS